ncbi:MAG: fructoselysine 6-kinase [Erysipelotrichales bacterium]|nr:fructoselysine 6-kinase [Erysipelotrichales bacterium]
MKVVCVGDNCIDYYTKTDQAFSGGNSVNVAVYCQRLGVQSSYIGVVGNDTFGKVLLESVASKGVDISHVRVMDGNTAVTEVEIIGNDRVFGEYDEGVLADFRVTSEDIEYIHTFEVMVSSLWSKVEYDLEKIDIPIAFDFADKWDSKMWELVLPHIQYAFYSDDVHEIEDIKEYMIRKWYDGLEVLVCTRGDKGSVAYDGHTFFKQGIIECSVVDTMGAGDSYIAGFLVEYFGSKDVKSAMVAGAKNSAITIGYQGAW